MTKKEREQIRQAQLGVMVENLGGWSCNNVQEFGGLKLRKRYARFFGQDVYTCWYNDTKELPETEQRLLMLELFLVAEGDVARGAK